MAIRRRRPQERLPLGSSDAVVVAPRGAEERLRRAPLRRRQHPAEGDQHAGGRAEKAGGEAALLRAVRALPGAARGQPRLGDRNGDQGGRGGVRLRGNSAGRRKSEVVWRGRRRGSTDRRSLERRCR